MLTSPSVEFDWAAPASGTLDQKFASPTQTRPSEIPSTELHSTRNFALNKSTFLQSKVDHHIQSQWPRYVILSLRAFILMLTSLSDVANQEGRRYVCEIYDEYFTSGTSDGRARSTQRPMQHTAASKSVAGRATKWLLDTIKRQTWSGATSKSTGTATNSACTATVSSTGLLRCFGARLLRSNDCRTYRSATLEDRNANKLLTVTGKYGTRYEQTDFPR